MLQVQFYEKMDDNRLKFAVIVSRHEGKWVFCKHRDRSTYECPGGHREAGESIVDAAKRELWEETGAVAYTLHPVSIYSVLHEEQGEESCGMLFFAEIQRFDVLPELEIESIQLFDELPEKWTYPEIQPHLLREVKQFIRRSIS